MISLPPGYKNAEHFHQHMVINLRIAENIIANGSKKRAAMYIKLLPGMKKDVIDAAALVAEESK